MTMRIELRDKRTGWLLVTYVADSIRQARERLRQILRHEERKRDTFYADQADVRDRIKRIADRWAAELGDNATPEQRKAMKELKRLAQQRIEWDEHGLEYKNRKD